MVSLTPSIPRKEFWIPVASVLKVGRILPRECQRAQDNGSQYIDGLETSSKASNATLVALEVMLVSHLDPDIVRGSQNGNLRRSTNRGGSVQTFFDSNIDEGG